MSDNDNLNKAALIKKALVLVDKLGGLDIKDDYELVDELVDEAAKLKKDRLWKLN